MSQWHAITRFHSAQFQAQNALPASANRTWLQLLCKAQGITNDWCKRTETNGVSVEVASWLLTQQLWAISYMLWGFLVQE